MNRKNILRITSLFLFLTVLLASLPCSAVSLSGYTKEAGYHYVALGSYPKEADGTVAPILWRILSVEDGYAYLLSEYVLFAHRVHEDYKEYEGFEGAFNRTEIFGILNGTFLETAFTKDEQEMLVFDEELGRVFLVDANDIKNKAYGFSSNKERQGFGTPYALANGLFKYRNTAHGRSSSPYWTRTRSTTLASGVRCTKADGSVGYIRCVVMDEGIRPAIRLKLTNGEIATVLGNGTLANPYVLSK